MLRHLPHQMPGNQHILVDLGAHRVWRYGAVPQAGHQHQAACGDIFQQGGHLPRHRPDRPLENPLLPAGQPLQG